MTLWPLALYFAAVVAIVLIMLGLSAALGERHAERATGTPYEGGIVPEGSARARLSARFYLVAMFFVIFDLEAVFLFAWAVVARDAGWLGYADMVIFVAVLLCTLIYLARVGALDWGPRTGRVR